MPMDYERYRAAKRANLFLIVGGLLLVLLGAIRGGYMDDSTLGVAVSLSGLALDYITDNFIELQD